MNPNKPSSVETAEQEPKWHQQKWARLGLLAATAGIGLVLFLSLSAESDDSLNSTIRAVRAEITDLTDFTTISGQLQYSGVSTVTAGSAGVVTDISADGATIERGDVLYRVNSEPVAVLFGDVAMYRSLDVGSSGEDVRLLEENLASLGYHAFTDEEGNETATGFLVDTEYTSATASAMERFQADLGVTETGSFDLTQFVIAGGPSIVSNIVAPKGSTVSPGTPVLTLNVDSFAGGLYSYHSGVIELPIEAGDEINSGDVVYVQDGFPVIAVVTEAEINRSLSEGVTDGDDVLAIEEMLSELGFDADGELVVDRTFDSATAAAVADWQALLTETYSSNANTETVTLDDVVAVNPTLSRVLGSNYEDDLTIASGAPLYDLGSVAGDRLVEASISAEDRDLVAVGDMVIVEFPGNAEGEGVITQLATSSTNEGGDASLPLTISLREIPESAAGLTELTVTVNITTTTAIDVVAVPASALIAQGGGEFAVETTDGETTEFVKVEPGLFAEGFVEVSGIEAGTAVVVPG